jgi:hypothetical protein
MFKKTVEFEDFDGNKQSRDFYFHISKAELIELSTSADDMQSRIKRIIEAGDGKAILHELREFIKLSVGVRSDDGQRFIKDEAAQNTLFQSPAYDELLMELATDANACANFVQQLIPETVGQRIRRRTADPPMLRWWPCPRKKCRLLGNGPSSWTSRSNSLSDGGWRGCHCSPQQ